MMEAKLHLGDKVVPNCRAPMWLMEGLRANRHRTVVGTFYDPRRRCTFYMLGHQSGHGHDIAGYAFRSYQLAAVVPRPCGRPRTRRHYRATASYPARPGAVDSPQRVVRPLAL